LSMSVVAMETSSNGPHRNDVTVASAVNILDSILSSVAITAVTSSAERGDEMGENSEVG